MTNHECSACANGDKDFPCPHVRKTSIWTRIANFILVLWS